MAERAARVRRFAVLRPAAPARHAAPVIDKLNAALQAALASAV
jgi:hypothetical protein